MNKDVFDRHKFLKATEVTIVGIAFSGLTTTPSLAHFEQRLTSILENGASIFSIYKNYHHYTC